MLMTDARNPGKGVVPKGFNVSTYREIGQSSTTPSSKSSRSESLRRKENILFRELSRIQIPMSPDKLDVEPGPTGEG